MVESDQEDSTIDKCNQDDEESLEIDADQLGMIVSETEGNCNIQDLEEMMSLPSSSQELDLPSSQESQDHPKYGKLAKFFDFKMLELVWEQFKISTLHDWQIECLTLPEV